MGAIDNLSSLVDQAVSTRDYENAALACLEIARQAAAEGFNEGAQNAIRIAQVYATLFVGAR